VRAVCPVCGTYGPLQTFLTDEAARRAVAAACALPHPLPGLVWPYLALFRRPGSGRVISWERAERLVAELAELVAQRELGWKGGRVVPHTPAHFAGAIQTLLDRDAQGRLERPLTSHNLLRAIAWEAAERDWYREHEARHQAAAHRAPEAPPTPQPQLEFVPAAARKAQWKEYMARMARAAKEGS
jgi:hypothetical protein